MPQELVSGWLKKMNWSKQLNFWEIYKVHTLEIVLSVHETDELMMLN